jgi:NAD(P)-dependent dehydrogenase (short-subunit alcohol dehydrogenase family)
MFLVGQKELAESGLPLVALVNNAGVVVHTPIEAATTAAWQYQFDVNVFGPLEVTRAFLPDLRAQSGRLVFVGSLAGEMSSPGMGVYSASKFALEAVVSSLRVELMPHDVAVSMVAPGRIASNITVRHLRDA